MKYKVIIMDDEPLIVKGLLKKIDWEKQKCEVVATAYDGETGKKLMDKHNPDIVITDIIMPKCSGLDVAKYCCDKHYKAKVILLSAYSDFEYAQKAIKYKVSEYILKPIEFNKLIESVKNVIKELEKENKLAKNQKNIKSTSSLSAHLLFDIARHGKGVLDNHNIDKSKLKIDSGVVLAVNIHNVNVQGDKNYLPTLQGDYISFFANTNYSLVRGSADDKMLFLCTLEKNIDLNTSRNRVIKLCENIGENIQNNREVICVTSISEPYRNFGELSDRYKQCIEMLEESYFLNTSKVIEKQIIRRKYDDIDIESVNTIISNLKNGNLYLLEQEFKEFLDSLYKERNQENINHVFKEIYWQATNVAVMSGMSNRPILKSDFISPNFFIVKNNIKNYLITICEYINTNQDLVGKVINLIRENYSSQDFGLAETAYQLNFSASYISRIFKNKTGINFVEYLMNLRLENAKKLLLQTNMSIEDISKHVGFGNKNYFGKVFKSFFKITPKQFRDQNK